MPSWGHVKVSSSKTRVCVVENVVKKVLYCDVTGCSALLREKCSLVRLVRKKVDEIKYDAKHSLSTYSSFAFALYTTF